MHQGRVLSNESLTVRESCILPYSKITLLLSNDAPLLGGMFSRNIVQQAAEDDDKNDDAYRRAPDDPIPEYEGHT